MITCHLFPKQLSGVRGIGIGFQYRPFSSLLGAEEGRKKRRKINIDSGCLPKVDTKALAARCFCREYRRICRSMQIYVPGHDTWSGMR